MAKPRDPRLNSLLTLLADITKESSLAYMADMPNPRGVQEAYRKMWRLYSERHTARMLTFAKGGAPARNRQCNTWLVEADTITNPIILLCNECKTNLHLCVQIDTSDLFFEEEGKTCVLHIYACPNSHDIVIMTSDKVIELTTEQMDKAWCIKRWHTIADHVNTNINVIIPDATKCVQCVDTPYTLTERTLQAQTGSKAGGEVTERYFKVHPHIIYNKALLFKDDKVKKLPNQTGGHCDCFIVTRSTQLLILHHSDLPLLDDVSISEIRVYRCNLCNTVNVVVYGQELEVDHPSVILDVKECFYHILRTTDAMNGVVIKVDKNKPNITGICRLDDFYYNEGKKHDILYSGIVSLQREHKEFLDGLNIPYIDSFADFIRFMKSYQGNPTGVEDELILEENEYTAKLKKGFYIGGKNTLLEGCIIYLRDEHTATIYGQVPVTKGSYNRPLTPIQRAFALKLGLKLSSTIQDEPSLFPQEEEDIHTIDIVKSPDDLSKTFPLQEEEDIHTIDLVKSPDDLSKTSSPIKDDKQSSLLSKGENKQEKGTTPIKKSPISVQSRAIIPIGRSSTPKQGIGIIPIRKSSISAQKETPPPIAKLPKQKEKSPIPEQKGTPPPIAKLPKQKETSIEQKEKSSDNTQIEVVTSNMNTSPNNIQIEEVFPIVRYSSTTEQKSITRESSPTRGLKLPLIKPEFDPFEEESDQEQVQEIRLEDLRDEEDSDENNSDEDGYQEDDDDEIYFNF